MEGEPARLKIVPNDFSLTQNNRKKFAVTEFEADGVIRKYSVHGKYAIVSARRETAGASNARREALFAGGGPAEGKFLFPARGGLGAGPAR
jgi:hypothetical protein